MFVRRLCSLQPHRMFVSSSWIEKIKGLVSPQKAASSFTLLRFAEEMGKARKMGSLKQYVVGTDSTLSSAFQKQEAILRYLGGFDPNGEKIKNSEKLEAAEKCNCTILEVENALAKFLWAKEAQKKVDKLKEEGKPLPTSMAEVQKLMGNMPSDLAQQNLAKSGQISRNALCPCGSKKRYKRCCLKE